METVPKIMLKTAKYLDYYDFDANTNEISYRYRVMMCALLMSCICRRFAEGGKPYSASHLRYVTGIPIRIVNDLLVELMNAELIVELTSDEKGETSRFLPAEDINNLTLGTMIDRIQSYGQWKLNIELAGQFSEKWGKAMELRSNYLHALRDIKLQDLRPLIQTSE
jgi:membrane protein